MPNCEALAFLLTSQLKPATCKGRGTHQVRGFDRPKHTSIGRVGQQNMQATSFITRATWQQCRVQVNCGNEPSPPPPAVILCVLLPLPLSAGMPRLFTWQLYSTLCAAPARHSVTGTVAATCAGTVVTPDAPQPRPHGFLAGCRIKQGCRQRHG